MASLYTRSDSPFIWLRFYDKRDPDPLKRRKALSTKFPNNREGWQAARDLKKRFEAGQVENDILIKSGIHLKKRILLSEGKLEYISHKPGMAQGTKDAYDLAVKHMINASTDKNIENYQHHDYTNLLLYFNKKEFSEQTKGIHTRHLYALWNYFLKRKYASENIIIIIKPANKPPEAIPYSDMQTLLKYYREKNKQQYYFAYFLLLTGFRVSTALVLKWDEIDFEGDIITATNVKAKYQKFYFPLHNELKDLLIEMTVKKKGRVFDQYTFGHSPKFWRVDIDRLYRRGVIGKKYTLHQIRKTFTSWLVNAGIDQSLVQKLLDHSDIRVTDQNYTQLEARLLKEQFKKLTFKKPAKKRKS